MKFFFAICAMLFGMASVFSQELFSADGSSVTVSQSQPDKDNGVQMAVDLHGEHTLAVRLVDGGSVEFIRDTATGNYRRSLPTIMTASNPPRFLTSSMSSVPFSMGSVLSPPASTGLIAGPDSLAIPIAVALPSTLHYSSLSHTNTTSALAASIMYSTNGGATWSNPILINGGMNHASLAAGTITIKSIAGKLVVSVSGSYSSPSPGFYTTTWVTNAPVAAITHVKFGTNMTFPAGLKLDGGGTYVLE